MRRKYKIFLKQLLRRLFELLQPLGINILPSHFYSQIPIIADLKKDDYWKASYTLVNIKGKDTNEQLLFVKDCMTESLVKEIAQLKIHSTAVSENGEDGGFGIIESDFLYAFIFNKKPSKIIQVGCGVSTSIILRACKEAGYRAEVICIEPFPMPYLINLSNNGFITLIKEKAQKVDINILTELGPNDLFFVDSTHTVKPGSEVNRIILEILPRLRKSVWGSFSRYLFPI